MRTGLRLGPYLLRRRLGAGAMGTVFLAHDPRSGLEVAIKTRTGGSAERFAREAQLTAQLAHPGILRVYDAGVDAATGVSAPCAGSRARARAGWRRGAPT